MITIYKFPLPIGDCPITTIAMPQGAQVKKFGVQNRVFCLWALVDTNKETENRTFQVFGTGHLIIDSPEHFNEEFAYVGSCSVDGFVWHLFERP